MSFSRYNGSDEESAGTGGLETSNEEHLPMDDSQIPSDLLEMLSQGQDHFSSAANRPVRRVLGGFAEPAGPMAGESEDEEDALPEERQAPAQPLRSGAAAGAGVVDGTEPGSDEEDDADAFTLQGLTMTKETPSAPERGREVAALESALRAVEDALRDGETGDVSLPVSVAGARPEGDVIDEVYRESFATAVRSVRQKLQTQTALALRTENVLPARNGDAVEEKEAEGLSNAFDVAFTRPALLQLARASKEIDFGEDLPVPSELLRVYFVEFLFRYSSVEARESLRSGDVNAFAVENDGAGFRGDAADLSTERLRVILRGHAAWPAYKTWLAAVEKGPLREFVTPGAREAVGRMVGLDLTANGGVGGGVRDDNAYAKARVRSLYGLQEFRALVERVARDVVFASRQRAALDEEKYQAEAVVALQTAAQAVENEDGAGEDDLLPLPTFLLTLPVADRRERVGNVSLQLALPPGTLERLMRTVDAYVTKSQGASEGVTENVADGRFVLSREFSAHPDPVLGEGVLRRAISRVPDGGDALAAALRGVVKTTRQKTLRTLAAGLKARVEEAKTLAKEQVPLVANRMERDGKGFVLRVQARGGPKKARIDVVWKFLPFSLGGQPAVLQRSSAPRGAAVTFTVVAPALPGKGGQTKRYTRAVAGFYWAEATLRADGGNGPVLSSVETPRAELHVFAKCARDGKIFDVSSDRVFGECAWRTGPDTRKRKRDRALYLQSDAEVAGFREPADAADDEAEKDPGESDGPIDLGDDSAVLRAIDGWTMQWLADGVYGYAATLARISKRLGDAAKARALLTPPEIAAAIEQASAEAKRSGREESGDVLFAFVRAFCATYTNEQLREELPETLAQAVIFGRPKVLQARGGVRSLPVLVVLGALQIPPASVALTEHEAQFFFETMRQRMLGEFLLAKENAILEGDTSSFAATSSRAVAPFSDAARNARKLRALRAVAVMGVDEVLGDGVWRKNAHLNSYKVKRAFFTDTASLQRLLRAGEQARLRLQAKRTAGTALRWVGVHNSDVRAPDWFRVVFSARNQPAPGQGNAQNAFPECRIAQRGSELPGVVGGKGEEIAKSVRAYNEAARTASEADLGAGGQGATAARLRMARLRGQVEKLVQEFNVALAKTSL